MQSQKEFTPALGYDFLTGVYDWAIKLTMPEKKFRAILIAEISPQTNEKILEFGFGTGQNLILLKQQFPDNQLFGVDIDPKVKKIAEAKIKKLNLPITLNLYNGFNLPYEDNTFDKVFSSLVFHQLDKESKKISLDELYRVLKPQGNLIIGDFGQAKSRWMRFCFYWVQLVDGFKTTADNVKGLLPKYMEEAHFKNPQEVAFINTNVGTYSYYSAYK
jgi:ubiquinone/menaquinone biosynthesis C-methylase UbiE